MNAENLVASIASNVDNENLTDEEFRTFVRNSIPTNPNPFADDHARLGRSEYARRQWTGCVVSRPHVTGSGTKAFPLP